MLTQKHVVNAGPGMHSDGRGLYLQVAPSGAKSWLLRYQVNGRRRAMGLGSVKDVSLAEARRLAAAHQTLIKTRSVDPIEVREAERAAQAAALAAEALACARPTFQQAAEALIASKRAEWRNDKHAKQWTSTLETYAYQLLGNHPVDQIDTAAVRRVLDPIWTTKTETANRVRGRIEAVLDAARVHGHRQGDNPARWRGNLDKVMASPNKVRKTQHHPALPFTDVTSFVRRLHDQPGVAAIAVEFLIHTACRSGEVRGAKWAEIDEAQDVWVIPQERMKAHREHAVPLTEEAKAVLAKARQLPQTEYVFPAPRAEGPLSDMTLTMLLRRMRSGITVHGFRSTFRDWVAETTEFPSELAEMALAHTVGNAVERAYRRGDMLGRRRKLMEAWSAYIVGHTVEVAVGTEFVETST